MAEKKKGLTYAGAGVDIDAADEALELVKKRIERTFPLIRRGKVITKLGGFGAVIELSNGMIIVATTDGVGTKLVVAILMDKHNTVGLDLNAMCDNDLIAVGVPPLLFLDYIVQGKQVPARTVELIKGIVDGCEQARKPLIAGEMAECPDLYDPEIYDLAGFAVGVADSRNNLILGDAVKVGMNVYGILSSGLHSNGYSLVRKIFGISLKTPVESIRKLNKHVPELGHTLGEELLKPTKIYVPDVEHLIEEYEISGLVNITGGGLVDNPPRVLPDGCAMLINLGSWEPQPIFHLMQKLGNVGLKEMLRATNCGIGFLVISPEDIPEEEGVVKIGGIFQCPNKKVFFQGKSLS